MHAIPKHIMYNPRHYKDMLTHQLHRLLLFVLNNNLHLFVTRWVLSERKIQNYYLLQLEIVNNRNQPLGTCRVWKQFMINIQY